MDLQRRTFELVDGLEADDVTRQRGSTSKQDLFSLSLGPIVNRAFRLFARNHLIRFACLIMSDFVIVSPDAQ